MWTSTAQDRLRLAEQAACPTADSAEGHIYEPAVRERPTPSPTPPPPIHSLRPEVPADIEKLLLAMLTKESEQRMGAMEVYDALLPFVHATVATGLPAPPTCRRVRRRSPLLGAQPGLPAPCGDRGYDRV